jgi:NAD(P)-dependent dehydrogenase (short-subunit alcohol dehydrogenase family)
MCKFGVVGFVKSLAVRLAKDKIRVNAIRTGPIDTPMVRVFVARPDQKSTIRRFTRSVRASWAGHWSNIATTP